MTKVSVEKSHTELILIALSEVFRTFWCLQILLEILFLFGLLQYSCFPCVGSSASLSISLGFPFIFYFPFPFMLEHGIKSASVLINFSTVSNPTVNLKLLQLFYFSELFMTLPY